MLLIITAVNRTERTFRVMGSVQNIMAVNDYLQVTHSTGNDGIYKITNITYAAGYSTITVAEPVPSAVADGAIATGVYRLTFSDPATPYMVVPPNDVNTQTSLTFNGKAVLNFGEWQQHNILHLLENFASPTAPVNPVEGQTWYDKTISGSRTFKNGTWSTDVHVEDGRITMTDTSHQVAGTKYTLSGSSGRFGVVLSPAVNPSQDRALFTVTDAANNAVVEIKFQGETTFSAPVRMKQTLDAEGALTVTTDDVSEITGPLVINSNDAAVAGLTITGDVVFTDDTAINRDGGASLSLSNAVVLKGTTATGGVIIASSNGTDVVVVSDNKVAFNRAVEGTSADFEYGTFDQASIETLNSTTIETDTIDAAEATVTVAAIDTLSVSSEITVPTPAKLESATPRSYVDAQTSNVRQELAHEVQTINDTIDQHVLTIDQRISDEVSTIEDALTTKVNVVEGKQLSTEDFSTKEKAKLSQVVLKQHLMLTCTPEDETLVQTSQLITFRMPYAFALAEVRASLTMAQEAGDEVTIDVTCDGESIFTVPLTIDNETKTSTMATEPAELGTTTLANDSEITVDVTQVDVDTTATGLKVYLIGYPLETEEVELPVEDGDTDA